MRGGRLIWLVLVAGLVTLAQVNRLTRKLHIPCSDHLWTMVGEEFEGFDNETGVQTGQYIVPNIVHFLRMGPKLKEFNFVDMVCILSAFRNQKPEKIYFHTDHSNFTGKYWDYLLRTEGFVEVMEFVPTDLPSEIFGQKFDPWHHMFHAGDILRIRLLMRFGGIFLDNDCYLVRNVDVYRKYEFVLSWDDHFFMGTQVLIGHKDARFLRLWLESYRGHYYPKLWYYNAGERPTKTILSARPELVHRVQVLFGTKNLVQELYHTVWSGWHSYYVVHLLVRHYERHPIRIQGKTFTLPDEFDERNILQYPITFRDMVQEVYLL